MSELEIRRRQEFKQMRKKWTLIQLVAVIVLAAMALVSFLIYNRMNRTQYIEYTEYGNADYKVQYQENDFFEGEWQDKEQSYISSLVNGLTADFAYKLSTTSPEMKFNYKYSINAKLLIASKEKGTPYYTVEENIVPEKGGRVENKTAIEIKETATIDFNKFDEIARSFVDTYNLDNSASCTLIVSLDVNTDCKNNGFADEHSLVYSTALNIPLATETFNIHRTSLSPENGIKVLEYTGVADRNFFLVWSISSIVAAAIVALVLLVFLQVTRNEDVTYAAKVRKILRSYGSFIQRMDGEFDYDGYQVIFIKTFVEMLGIRDTIQSPVLVTENKDETMTRFFIPTNTKLLYVFEIKIDNYDEIYARIAEAEREAAESVSETIEEVIPEPIIEEVIPEAIEEPAVEEAIVEEPVIEEPVIEEPATEEPIAEEPIIEEPVAEEVAVEEPVAEEHNEAIEAILDHLVEAEPSGDDSEDGEAVLAYVDEAGNVVRITCARSYTANLIQSNPTIKEYYNEIKNYILSFKGVKARISWRSESYKKGRIQLFKMKIRGKMICLYCALDPSEYDSAKYFHQVSDAKAYAAVPMMVKIKSDRGLKRAKELVDDVMAKFFILPDGKAQSVDFSAEYPYDTTKNLVERGLIKLLLPDAVAAEPKPHHHVHKKTVEVVTEDAVEEIVVFDTDKVDEAMIEEMVAEPTPELDAIDFDDASEEVVDFVETEDHPGVDVIGVVWPERPKRNKIYRYDPDGEVVSAGDVVIVPTRDVSRNKDVIRKAAVAHANHKVPVEELKHPLKKIVGVLHKKALDEKEKAEK